MFSFSPDCICLYLKGFIWDNLGDNRKGRAPRALILQGFPVPAITAIRSQRRPSRSAVQQALTDSNHYLPKRPYRTEASFLCLLNCYRPKHSRASSLGALVALLVLSRLRFAFIRHRRRRSLVTSRHSRCGRS